MSFFYYLFFVIIYSAKMVGLYDGQKAFYVCVAIGLIFYCMKIATTRMSIPEYIVTILLVGLGLVVYVFSGEKGLLLCLAMVTGAKNVDCSKLIKCLLGVGSTLFGIMILLTSLGIIGDNHHITEKFGVGALIRRDFGQPSSNVTHTVFFVLVSLVIYLYGEKRHLIKLSIFIMVLNVILFAYTLSITGVLSVTFLLVVNLVVTKMTRIDTKVLRILSNAAYVMLLFVSIILPLVVEGRAYDILNKILNHRIEYGRYYLTHEQLSLFGSRFAQAPDINFYLDNSYLYLFLQLGVITFGVVMLIMLIALNGLIMSNDKAAFVMFVSYSFIGLSDPFLFNTSFKNITLILVGKYLYDYLRKFAGKRENYSIIPAEKVEDMQIYAKVKGALDAEYRFLCSCASMINKFFEGNADKMIVLFIIVPVLATICYYLFPQLFDISLLANGDRLVYQFEDEIIGNHNINRTYCILRTGLLDGAFISALIVTGRIVYDKRFIHNNNSKL